jgi:Mce-associated membrane protein
MTQTRRSGGRGALVTAVVFGVVAIALAAVLVVFHLPSRHGRVQPASAGALTGTEQTAMTAASQEVVNLLTYTRKSFDSDFTRALNGMTGSLRTDQTKAKASTLAAMNKGKFDLKGEVTATALEQNSGKTMTVLISATGYQVPASGTPNPVTYARFEITVTKSGDKWLASDLQSVGLT